jgi:PEP-CTERM motif
MSILTVVSKRKVFGFSQRAYERDAMNMGGKLSCFLGKKTPALSVAELSPIRRQSFRFLRHRLRVAGPVLALCFLASPTWAVVKFSDGFGDADLNNNGVPLELVDVDAGINDTAGDTWRPGRLSAGGPLLGDYNGNSVVDAADYTVWRDTLTAGGTVLQNDSTPGVVDESDFIYWRGHFGSSGPTNQEVTSVLNAGDTGLRWLHGGGITTPNGQGEYDPAPTLRIVDDSQGAQQETFASAADPVSVAAIDDGYAMAYNSKGRGKTAMAFFDENVALGPQVGDQVKVSFEFRVWRDAPNANNFVQPIDAQLRFGLFQDTDGQLGMTNNYAGPLNTPAVWGQEGGRFDGDAANPAVPTLTVGAYGDHGWLTNVDLYDPAFGAPLNPQGEGARIREETNEGAVGSNDIRIMQGSAPETDFVASPDPLDPIDPTTFVTMDVNKVYRLSLTLERATDATPGDTIKAIFEVEDLATATVYTLSGTEPLFRDDGMGGMIADGISSDNWDYFAIRNTGTDDFDFILDNFLLEIFGSNAGAGAGSGASAVPEPGSIVLLTLGTLLALAVRRRR